jgi:phage tail sheath protein FI
MPEYLAPGVYVEEVSFRSKSIEGVSTTTTGFIGPARYGPTDLEPEIITSLAEFERVYGDQQQLYFKAVDEITHDETDVPPMHNYLWHAVRAFFTEGGKRLYISRVFLPIGPDNDGYADAWFPASDPQGDDRAANVRVRARYPGNAGKMRVRLTLRLGPNTLTLEPLPGDLSQDRTTVRSLMDGDVVWISNLVGSPPSPMAPDQESGDYYIARQIIDPVTKEITWKFNTAFDADPVSNPVAELLLSDLRADANPLQSDKVRVVTLTVTVMHEGQSDLPPLVYENLPLDPEHKRASELDSVFSRMGDRPSSLADRRRIPIVIEPGRADDETTQITSGISLLQALFDTRTDLVAALSSPTSTDAERSIDLLLANGNDGQRPGATEYEGTAEEDDVVKTGLKSFEDIEDISIVAAPGSSYGYENGYRRDAATIMNLLIAHAQRMRYRIAVLDSGNGQTIADVRNLRARIDSKYAALYYPWVRVLDPVTRKEIDLPPSGFVAGIYARNDIERAVYKAPANEVVNLAIGFEMLLNKAQQEVLNPEGINCFRFFEGRGFRLWGARTISSDPEWKYVNVRRYFAYLERSIDRGTQWAVFEPNGTALWDNVRRTIEDFLLNEWQSGALLGEKPEKAFFVKCDRSTMTQNDLDNGRLICLIGVAPLKPAEFVIFRIGQWTADRKA